MKLEKSGKVNHKFYILKNSGVDNLFSVARTMFDNPISLTNLEC